MNKNTLLLVGIGVVLYLYSKEKKETIVDTEQNSGSGEATNPDVVLDNVRVDSSGPHINSGVKTNVNSGATTNVNTGASSGSSDFRVGRL